jgi:hypothetical protein
MKKLFAFALAASSVALVSAPAMALPTNDALTVELEFVPSGVSVEENVGTITCFPPIPDVDAHGFQVCEYPCKWEISFGGVTLSNSNLYLNETQVDGINDCDVNSMDFVDSDLSLAAPSTGFTIAFQKKGIARLAAGEAGPEDAPGNAGNVVFGTIRFVTGATYSFELFN